MKRLLLYTFIVFLLSYAAINLIPGKQGYTMLVAVADSATGDIYITDLERNFYLPLVTNPEDDFQPVWSPDGRWLAYTTYELHDNGWRTAKVMVTDTVGRRHRLAGYAPGYNHDRIIRWSPDSRYVFISWQGSGSEGSSIYDVRADREISVENFKANLPPRGQADYLWMHKSNLIWSSDGSKMAITYYFPENIDDPETTVLFAVDSDDFAVRQTVVFRSTVNDMAWSQDGRWMALSHFQPYPSYFKHISYDPYHSLTLVSADGSTIYTVYRTRNFLWHFSWSSDAKYLYFIEVQPDPFQSDLRVASLHRLELSTWSVETVVILPQPWYTDAIWSSDSNYLLLFYPSLNYGLHIVDVANKSIQRIGNFDGSDFQFSNNDDWIYFQEDDYWYRLRLDGTDLERIVEVCWVHCPRPFMEIEN